MATYLIEVKATACQRIGMKNKEYAGKTVF